MKRSIGFIILVSFIFLQGCMTARFLVSRPQVEKSSDVKVSQSGIIKAKDIKIAVRAYNFSGNLSVLCLGMRVPKKFENLERAFYIELGFLPKSDGFGFSPRDVTLNLEGMILKPIAAYGPVYTRESYIRTLFFFEESKKAFFNESISNLAEADSIVRLEAGKWTGAILKFEVYPPNVAEAFSLNLEGLQKDDGSLSLPQINFQKKSALVIDDIY